jgi:hypothetical protein
MDPSRLNAFRRSRWYKPLVWALTGFVIYVLLGFFALPPLIRWQMLKQLPIATKRQASIRQVKVNPLTLSLSIRGLALTEPDGRTFASWDDLYINFQSSSLFRWAWTFKEIRLVKPFGQIIMLPDGRLNFANMFDSSTKPAPAPSKKETSVPRVNIFELQVTNGFVALEDQTRRPPFHTEYRPINWILSNFSTRPGIATPYSFRAASDAGRSITWEGDLSVQPLSSLGHLVLTGIRLGRYQPYYEDFTHALVSTNGSADASIDYYFAASTNGTELIVTNGMVHVGHLQLLDPETSEAVAGLQSFDAREAQLNLRERTARLGNVKISEASALVRRKPNGHLNLLDLLTVREPATNSPPAPSTPTTPWTADVDALAIEKTTVTLEDLALPTPFKTKLDPFELSLKDFTTGTNSKGRYSFHLATESAKTVEGAGTLSINPPSSAGELKWAAVELKKYMPYAEAFFQGKLTAGQVAGQVPYTFLQSTNSLEAGVSNVSVTITGLELKAPGSDENVITIPRFAIEGVEASLSEHRARVASIKSEQGSVLCRRQHDGSINLLQLLAPAATNSTPANVSATNPTNSPGSSNESPAWTASVDDISIDNYTIKVEDQQPPKPATFLLDQLALNVKDASTLSNAPVSARLGLRFNETGAVALQAKATLEPRVADVQLDLTNIDLRAMQPYLEDYVRLGIVSGALGAGFDAHYQTADPAAAQVKVTGRVNIANFACTDEVASKEFMSWDDLAVSGIDADLEPTRLKVAEVKWVAPKTSVVIGADHKSNVASILKKEAADSTNAARPVAQSAPKQSASQTRAESIPIQVDAILLEQTSLSVVDESIEPHATMGIQELSGSIKGLSSESNTAADVNFAGKIDEHSPFAIIGRINPLATDLFADLAISNANTQLIPLSTYTAKYAGHPLNHGRLSTDLRYHVEGKQINAENKIYVDQLMLGPRNNSPDATSLPVKLGIALLKDSNGRITLDVPVQGRIDDPKFRIAPVVFKVLVDMITKAAASPFKLLGALVGGGGEELSFVKFYPGGTNVVEGELNKLGKLSKALAQRPGLSLEIEGAIDPVADREAIATQKLREQLKAKELQQLDSRGKAAQSVDSFQIPQEDYEQLLRETFAEKFGTNIAAILRTNQMALGATNKPTGRTDSNSARHPKQSAPKRFLAWVGLSGNHQSKAEKNLSKADRLALRQLTPQQMETMLANGVEVTRDDYRDLMSARAHLVQAWLEQSAQVSNERLLLNDPRPVDAAYQGESRVQLSLE